MGWASYRDQWISEAMASYSALFYARNKLAADRASLASLTFDWQRDLLESLPDGRVIESVGPVVLGQRLESSRSEDAYRLIVYKKGAVILDMLARSLGQERFPKIAAQVVKAVPFQLVSTEDFFALIERVASVDLQPFVRQYVYGTGLPEVYYSYRFEREDPDKWVVRGQAEQLAPYRYRFRVIKTPRGFDAARERIDQVEVADSKLVVPVDVAVYDPSHDQAKAGKSGTAGKRANAVIKGNLLLAGEKTEFAIDVEHEPEEFWLDRNVEVFGRFFDERRNPKRFLYFRGLDAAAAGHSDEAEELFAKALAAEVEADPSPGSSGSGRRPQDKWLDGLIELSLARLQLDQGRDAQARAAFNRANKLLSPWHEAAELKIIESRLDIREGNFEAAFRRLRKGLIRWGTLEGTEGYILLAIAARATGHPEDEKEAIKMATDHGADLAALTEGKLED